MTTKVRLQEQITFHHLVFHACSKGPLQEHHLYSYTGTGRTEEWKSLVTFALKTTTQDQ